MQRNQPTGLAGETAEDQAGRAFTASAPSPAAPSPDASRFRLQVTVPRADAHVGPDSVEFSLALNRWERLTIPLPEDGRGGELRLGTGRATGLLEIAAVGLFSTVTGEPRWELPGPGLLEHLRVTPDALVVSSTRRFRLLCVGDDAQISLRVAGLPGEDEPLTLEIGLRVRTEPVLIGCALHEWLEDAQARQQEALLQAAAVRAESHNQVTVSQARLVANEAARAASENHAAILSAELEVARADGNRREAALKEQLACAHQAAREHAATLLGEIGMARTYGDERAAALTDALEAARAHGDQRATALTAEMQAVREDANRQVQSDQQRWERTQAQLHTAEVELVRRMEEAAEARRVGEEAQGRVRSMQRSVSWRATLFLRIIGRTLTGGRRSSRHGASPAANP